MLLIHETEIPQLPSIEAPVLSNAQCTEHVAGPAWLTNWVNAGSVADIERSGASKAVHLDTFRGMAEAQDCTADRAPANQVSVE